MSKKSSERLTSSLNASALAKQIKQPGPAPVHLWDPPYCGEIDIRIVRDGTWLHNGQPIRRPAMIQLFSSVLKKEQDKYYLVTPVEKVGIQVDDCPFIAQSLSVMGQNEKQQLEFLLNTHEPVVAGKEHAIIVEENVESGEPHPMIHVRNGLHALLARSVFYQLVELAVERPAEEGICLVVNSDQCTFELGNISA